MTFFPDMGCSAMVASGDYVRAVGWLHPGHPYTQGPVDARFLDRLKELVSRSGYSAQALGFGASGGVHECEFCHRAIGINNFGVPHGELLFVAPEMIVHYIERHNYSPPSEFIDAVLRSPLPDSEEYQVITEPFWHLHRAPMDQLMQSEKKA